MGNYSLDNPWIQGLGEYPPPAFYFKVVFATAFGVSDTSFQEVSGISAELETEEVQEGGENACKLIMPKAIKYSNLVLKRGLAATNSPLTMWCRDVLESNLMKPIKPTDLCVFLMNGEGVPIRGWSFVRAYPIKWSVDSFDSMNNKVAIETIELKYHSSSRTM